MHTALQILGWISNCATIYVYSGYHAPKILVDCTSYSSSLYIPLLSSHLCSDSVRMNAPNGQTNVYAAIPGGFPNPVLNEDGLDLTDRDYDDIPDAPTTYAVVAAAAAAARGGPDHNVDHGQPGIDDYRGGDTPQTELPLAIGTQDVYEQMHSAAPPCDSEVPI